MRQHSGDAQLDEILQLTNRVRANAGLVALGFDARLSQASLDHAIFLAASGFISHGGSGDSLPGDRATAAGYHWKRIGENVLARTQADPPAAFDQWWQSAGHRDNLLGPDFTDCGLGRAYSPRVDCWYYTMLVAKPA